jgi:Ca2+-binding RTX toxin-like protein
MIHMPKRELLLSVALFSTGLLIVGSSANTYLNHAYGANPPIGTQSGEPDDQSPIGDFILCAGAFFNPTPNICLGTNEADQIVGTIGADFIYAKDGKDKVMGENGDDILYGENGDDVLQGGTGSDRLYGMDGNDYIFGDIGGNLLFGGGSNYLEGGDGDDVLIGSLDSDVMKGGLGRDYFECSEATDVILDFDPTKDTKSQNCEFF